MRELVKLGHKVYIARPTERQFKQPTNIKESLGAKILSVKTLNIQKTNVVEKGIATLSLEYLFGRAIKKYWGDIKFDLVLYSTPPITFNKVIQSVKSRCGARSYLLLKDIFPQNAVDLQMMSKNSLIYKLFRKKEETLYAISDKIGCMSPANVQYVIDNNPSVNPAKVEVCPNSITLPAPSPISDGVKTELKQKLSIPTDKTLFIYGGNLGKPQGIDFLIKVVAENEHNHDSFIMIVGSGTEFGKIQNWFNEHNPQNAKLMSALPKAEYDKLIKTADVGLIFLDPRFTIPNYPSRLLAYQENHMPILMATDVNTDIGSIAESNGYGLWSKSGDIDTFMQHMKKLSSDYALRQSMGEAGYTFLCNNYLTEHAISKILKA
jgi:glycosyltransferase involved in cell wall biosynthesis